MNPHLVVPTLGNRNESLEPLLRDAGMPGVVVVTGDTRPSVECRLVADHQRPLNIQRWWNRGIDAAVECGADVVVVVNDDVAAAPGALLELAARIEPGEPGSPMLVWPENKGHASTRVTGITGYCFALDPRRIRPDEAFCWWYGEHDLELRARAMRPDGGAMSVRVGGIKHLRTGYTYDRPVDHLIKQDRRLFARRYPDLMGGWGR